MTVSDVVNYIQAQYKESKHVPSVKELRSKKIVKSAGEFYKLFPGKMSEACTKAGVPVPTERIGRVKNALERRLSHPQPTQTETNVIPQAPENIKPETGTPALDPLLKQVLDKEREVAERRSRLKLAQRLRNADAANKRIKHLEAVSNYRPSSLCSAYGCFKELRHWSEGIFTCDAGHSVIHLCPVCKHPLNYDETGYSCPAC